MSLDIVAVTTGDKFPSLAKIFDAMASLILNGMNWLKSASPTLRFCSSQISMLSSVLKTLKFSSKFWNQF